MKTYMDSAYDKDMKLAEKMRHARVAYSGSCASLILYDPTTYTLYTACTGDSRAILAMMHSNNNGTWERILLADDQSGDNEDEVTRIQKEHPGEEPIKDGKLLGLGVYRAFGDSVYKLSHEIQTDLSKRFWTYGAKGQDETPTPPYLTAEPIVTVTKLKQQPGFVILASDGLWDECSSEEVVDLVVRWLKFQPENVKFFNTTLSKLKVKELPKPAERPPGFDFLGLWHGFDARFLEERTTVKDLDNVAIHLIRNAFGGNHEELLAGKLAAQFPHSRNVRDDITVQVIFFTWSEE